MSDALTKKMLPMYLQEASATMFLSGFFQSPAVNFHTSETVEIDIMRNEEDVAIVVTDLTTGNRANADDLYTNKRFKPPIYQEEAPLQAYDLMKREAGQDPFQSPNYQANAVVRAFRIFQRLEMKIRRAIELQAAQVLQTGQLTLRNQDGVALYTVDFAPKATHFPTAGTTWGDTGDDKIGDLEALAKVVRTDGLVTPNRLVFGLKAWSEFIDDESVQNRLDNRRMSLGEVAPETRGQGGTFQGYIWLGNYRFEMWTYDGYYKSPETGASTPYVDTGSVIMLSTQTRLDLTFGAIPLIVPPEGRALPFLPPRLPNERGGMDLTTNSWVTPNGQTLMVMAGTRPMTIPTAIDAYGCLDTGLVDA